jgi:stage V sporulation protein AD
MPVVTATGSVVGPREGQGPLGRLFDLTYRDTLGGETSWERAESRMLRQAVTSLWRRRGSPTNGIDFLLAGDLLNQMCRRVYVAREHDIPYFGLYGACSTIGGYGYRLPPHRGGFARNVLVCTSSHHDTAERQYRYPTEFGYQRVPVSQWTVTAAGAAIVSASGKGPRIEAVTVGRVQDYGVKDANDMGTAMAPAFADTVRRHLKDMGRKPEDYDAIFSGDLGKVGSDVALALLKQSGIELAGRHYDTALMIYEMKPEVASGASGCGCVGSVFAAQIWAELAMCQCAGSCLCRPGRSTVRQCASKVSPSRNRPRPFPLSPRISRQKSKRRPKHDSP